MYFSSTFPLSSLTVLFQTKLSSRSSLLRISSTKYCPKKERYLNEKNRGIHAHSCIMGNEGKMAGNSKICIGIQSHSRFSVLFFWTRKLLFSNRKHQIYINLLRNSGLWILIQIFEFPAILPWLPMMQLWAWTPLFYSTLLFQDSDSAACMSL